MTVMCFCWPQEQKPQKLAGSMILFTRNGSSQGPAFTDIPEGTYYPAASLFTMPEQSEGATVVFNFGPDFKYPPPEVCAPCMHDESHPDTLSTAAGTVWWLEKQLQVGKV